MFDERRTLLNRGGRDSSRATRNNEGNDISDGMAMSLEYVHGLVPTYLAPQPSRRLHELEFGLAEDAGARAGFCI